jgi:hypothetical protein
MPDLRLIVPDCRDSTVSLLFAYNILEAATARMFSLSSSPFPDLILCWLCRELRSSSVVVSQLPLSCWIFSTEHAVNPLRARKHQFVSTNTMNLIAAVLCVYE